MRSLVSTAVQLLALLATLPAYGIGADDESVRSIYYLEQSGIFFSPGGETLFETQISPQLIVWQDLHELVTSGDLVASPGFHLAQSYSISPMVRLRMAKSRSHPVRTPSFMPHAVAQVFFVRNLDSGPTSDDRIEGPFEFWTTQIRLSHYSNGQDGCLYSNQTFVVPADGTEDDGGCRFAEGQGPSADNINFNDGSFSTNFLRASLLYRRLNRGMLPGGVPDDYVGFSWYAGLGAESDSNPLIDWMPGSLSERQEVLYGSWRWQALLGCAWRHSGRLSGGTLVDIRFEHSPDVGENVPSWSFSASGSRPFTQFGGWGPYVRFYHGQDFYNLAFVNEVTRLHLGLAFGEFNFDRFGIPSM